VNKQLAYLLDLRICGRISLCSRRACYREYVLFCHRCGRHSGRKPEADPGTDLAPDPSLPDHSRPDAAQETHVGLDQRRSVGLRHLQLHHRLERRTRSSVRHQLDYLSAVKFAGHFNPLTPTVAIWVQL